MSNKKKDFDTVEMMRRLRCEVEKQLAGKSYEEQRRYLDERVPLRGKSEDRPRQKAL